MAKKAKTKNLADNNPISLGEDGPFFDFKIPEENLQDDIKISIEIELLDDGWKFDSDHIVAIQGNPEDLYNDDPAPEQLDIGTGEEINGKKLRTFSRIRRIRDGAPNNIPSKVKFNIIFLAGDTTIGEFTRTCDKTNPENFITNIKFK
ncbi:MAG TPA: hypothetical protein VJU52_03725 [Flavobacterium sp.]|nr:hypothetical protein [Flavobacterium sp.]